MLLFGVPLCRIPAGTSPELTALLQGLLRRNAKDRMEFDDFFNHPFIRRPELQASPPPLPSASRLSTPPKSCSAAVPIAAPAGLTPPPPLMLNNNAPTPPEEADDFVLVPSPTQLTSRVTAANQNQVVVQGTSQPIPVPSQRSAFIKVSYSFTSASTCVGMALRMTASCNMSCGCFGAFSGLSSFGFHLVPYMQTERLAPPKRSAPTFQSAGSLVDSRIDSRVAVQDHRFTDSCTGSWILIRGLLFTDSDSRILAQIHRFTDSGLDTRILIHGF